MLHRCPGKLKGADETATTLGVGCRYFRIAKAHRHGKPSECKLSMVKPYAVPRTLGIQYVLAAVVLGLLTLRVDDSGHGLFCQPERRLLFAFRYRGNVALADRPVLL